MNKMIDFTKFIQRRLLKQQQQQQQQPTLETGQNLILGVRSHCNCCCSVTELCQTLQPHALQHTRLSCPSPSPRVCSNTCPLSQWCYLTISSSVSLLLSIFPIIRVFTNKSALHIRWSKYWSFSFSISTSIEYSGLISFRTDLFDLLAVKGFSRVFSSTIV